MKSIKLLIVFVVLLSACKSKYPDLEEGLYADIQTNIGDVLVKLHYEKVPMTVANFVALTEGNHPKLIDSLQGVPFYNGLIFHRVIKNFMIQGGDAKGAGRGSKLYSFEDEFPSDLNGKLFFKHDKPGVLSMANSGPNTNFSQFFITHKPTPWLDGKHSVFGETLFGQNSVDSIQKGDFIKKIDIIRVGSKARNFNAPSIFLEELGKSETREKERKEKIVLARKLFQQKMGIDKAFTTDSGLKILHLKTGNGKKVNSALPTTAHYSLYTTDGKKIDASLDRDTPIVFTLNEDPLIAGWKEGVAQMVEGEKSRLFIPSYLGYGSIGEPPFIQPNEDLILEIEILKVGK